MLILPIDDILYRAVEIVQNRLALLLRLGNGALFVLLVLLRGAGSLAEIVLHAELLGTHFDDAFEEFSRRVAAGSIGGEGP